LAFSRNACRSFRGRVVHLLRWRGVGKFVHQVDRQAQEFSFHRGQMSLRSSSNPGGPFRASRITNCRPSEVISNLNCRRSDSSWVRSAKPDFSNSASTRVSVWGCTPSARASALGVFGPSRYICPRMLCLAPLSSGARDSNRRRRLRPAKVRRILTAVSTISCSTSMIVRDIVLSSPQRADRGPHYSSKRPCESAIQAPFCGRLLGVKQAIGFNRFAEPLRKVPNSQNKEPCRSYLAGCIGGKL
jgi:hypothetical protein